MLTGPRLKNLESDFWQGDRSVPMASFTCGQQESETSANPKSSQLWTQKSSNSAECRLGAAGRTYTPQAAVEFRFQLHDFLVALQLMYHSACTMHENDGDNFYLISLTTVYALNHKVKVSLSRLWWRYLSRCMHVRTKQNLVKLFLFGPKHRIRQQQELLWQYFSQQF